jgi:hypothetical protein
MFVFCMDDIIKEAIKETARVTQFPEHLVKEVVFHYFSKLKTVFEDGNFNVKIPYLAKFKRNGVDRIRPNKSGTENNS